MLQNYHNNGIIDMIKCVKSASVKEKLRKLSNGKSSAIAFYLFLLLIYK